MRRVPVEPGFVALIGDGVVPEAGALEQMAATGADVVYADERRPDGSEFRKPVWSPERLRCQPWLGGLVVVRAGLLDEVGAPDDGPAAFFDLQLRLTERAGSVARVPEVLFTAPEERLPGAVLAPVVQAHLDRVGIAGTALPGPEDGTVRITRRLDPDRRISVVIPTNGSRGVVRGRERVFVVEAVRDLLAGTRHHDLEVVVVYDAPTPAEVLDDLRRLAGERLVLVRYDKPFSHSEKSNLGVLHSSGDRIVLMNDDIEGISERWLEELVAPLDEPDVGMTGARLLFEDEMVQHAGHVYADRKYTHVWYREPRHASGPHQALVVSREASGVTAAVAGLRRETYLEVGGLSNELPTSYNDIDLSYKVRRAGYRILWLAGVELFHFESVSRGKQLVREERLKMAPALSRWGWPGEDDYLPAGSR